MNEEQAVLDFFSQRENLPLALSVAERVDRIRQRMNNEFWIEFGKRAPLIAPGWQVELTEDRNTEDCLVGIHLQPATAQTLFLRPMLEQQMASGAQRIYFGLMWSSPPTQDKSSLPEVAALRDSLQQQGYKNNANFLAWQWSPYYPRSKDFLLRLSGSPDSLMEETSGLLRQLLTHGAMLQAANQALRASPRSAAILLDSLRSNLSR